MNDEEKKVNKDSLNIEFVTTGTTLKKKKNPFLIISIILTILLLIGLIGYFVIYPYVLKTYFQDPKEVFETTIKEVTKEINALAKEKQNKETYTLSLSVLSDIPEFQDFVGFTYSAHLGKDLDNDNLEFGFKVEDNENNYFENFYKKENTYYTKFSNYPDLYYLEETEEVENLFSSLKDVLSNIDKLNKEDISYVTTFLASKLISSIDPSKLEKKEENIILNNEKIKVTRNYYTMDEDIQVKTINELYNAIEEDEKFLSILSSLLNQEENQVKENLKERKEKIDTKKTIVLSIYTQGRKNNIIGYSYEKENTSIHYFKYKDNFEIVLKNLEEMEKDINIIGTKKKETTEVVVSTEEKEVLKLNIREWTSNKIDFDYTILKEFSNVLEENLSGSFLYEKEQNPNNTLHTFSLRINIEDNYMELKGNIMHNWDKEVSNINSTAAKGLNKNTYKEMQNDLFKKMIKETPLQIFFSTLSDSFDPDIYSYYERENKKESVNQEQIEETN